MSNTITIQDAYGYKHEIPAALARIMRERNEPVTITLYPEMVGEPPDDADPTERYSPLDRLIARVVDEHGPVNAGEIARILEDEHDHITTDKGVRDRFGNSLPLKAAGYRSTGRGYVSPEPAGPELYNSDALIAEVIDKHGPVQADAISMLLEQEHDHVMAAPGVHDRFRTGRPLRRAGYRSTRKGYASPRHAAGKPKRRTPKPKPAGTDYTPMPRERLLELSDLERLIATTIDEHGPVNSKQIAWLLEEEHNQQVEPGVVRDLLADDKPLAAAGYANTAKGYDRQEVAA